MNKWYLVSFTLSIVFHLRSIERELGELSQKLTELAKVVKKVEGTGGPVKPSGEETLKPWVPREAFSETTDEYNLVVVLDLAQLKDKIPLFEAALELLCVKFKVVFPVVQDTTFSIPYGKAFFDKFKDEIVGMPTGGSTSVYHGMKARILIAMLFYEEAQKPGSWNLVWDEGLAEPLKSTLAGFIKEFKILAEKHHWPYGTKKT
jgi:hypothetical protein